MKSQETILKKQGKTFNKEIIQKFAAFLSLILMFVFFSLATPHFLNLENLITVALQTSVIGIMALGITFVIITSGIDLSVGAIIALSGVASALAIEAGTSIFVGIIVGVIVGMFIGLVNGLLISKAGLPPFIATLGMMMCARGITLVLTEGRPVYFRSAPNFLNISQAKLFGVIPYPVMYLFILAIVANLILTKTSTGRYVYAVGSNEEAARLSGINVIKTKLFVYAFSGLLSGFAGIVMAARLNSAQPTIGQGYELDAVASAVIGGTSLAGGEGTITGTVIGAFIMSVLKNGLNLMNVSQFWQMVAMGLVVIAAVYMDIIRKRK